MENVLICGFARSGQALMRLCERINIKASIYSDNTIEKETKNNFGDNITYYDSNDNIPKNFSEIILSPGINLNHKIVQHFKNLGVPIIGELEFSSRLTKNEIISVTGTNGKGTTCLLISDVLKNGGYDNIVLGNIGIPLAEQVLDIPEKTLIILETSCAQLSTICFFHPKVSVVTNIVPEHLNFYESFEEYKSHKVKICKNQDIRDFCIINADDDTCRHMFENIKTQKLLFSSKAKISNGAYLNLEGNLVLANENNSVYICNVNEIKKGTKDSALIASIVGGIYKITPNKIRSALVDFIGVEHAVELFLTLNHTNFFNDSKATNQYSTIHAINSIITNIVLLTGGQDDKNCDYHDLALCIKEKVKYAILIGETSSKIANKLNELNYHTFKSFKSFEEAVNYLVVVADERDNVLFSPGANSRDMFENHKKRGEIFKELIQRIVNV